MNKYKLILVAALTILSGTALQAQTNLGKIQLTGYNDSVRTKTWTVYAGGGVCGYHGLRGVRSNGKQSYVKPDFSIGTKYYFKPWVRVGLNVGYMQMLYKNNNSEKSTSTSTGYIIGDYNDGTLTTDKVIGMESLKQNVLYTDINTDFNILEAFKKHCPRLNLWAGTGVGYLHGWTKESIGTAVSEEAVAKGDDHFNVYNHDYVTTRTCKGNTNALYIPFRLSLEYDITPRWTAGVKGEYKYLPLNQELTPKGIWSAGVTLAYNFTTYGSRKRLVSDYENEIAKLNDLIKELQKDKEDAAASKALQAEIQKLKEGLCTCKEGHCICDCKTKNSTDTIGMNPVFYRVNETEVRKSQIGSIMTAANILRAYPDSKIYIKGYASPEGNIDHNIKLADARAKAVAEVLTRKYGISPDRISCEGCGTTDKLYTIFELNRVAMLYIEK